MERLAQHHEVVVAYWGLLFAVASFALTTALNYIFPQKIQGPRADNLKVSTARYGALLARVHGRAKVAGHHIWLKGNQIEERAHTHREGGFFGLFGSTKVTEYTYHSTFAVAFTDHEIQAIPRLWFDGQLVYDATQEALEQAAAGQGTLFGGNQLSFRLYRGTADQIPAPEIADDVGAALAEAYPGTSYIVIRDWNHEDTGIRLPDVEAEIVTEAEETFNLGSFSASGLGLSGDESDGEFNSDYDPERQLLAHVYRSQGFVVVWRAQDRVPLWAVDLETRDLWANHGSGIVFDGEGHLLLAAGGTIYVYDAYTGALLDTVAGTGLPDDGVSTVHRAVGLDRDTGRRWIYFYLVTTLCRVALDPLTRAWTGESLGAFTPHSSSDVTAMTADADDRVWLSGGFLFSVGATLWEIAIAAGFASQTAHDLTGIIASGHIAGVAYLPDDDTLLLIGGEVDRILKVDAGDPDTVLATYDNFVTSDNQKTGWSRRGWALWPEFAAIDLNSIHLIDAQYLTRLDRWLLTEWAAALPLYEDWIYDARQRALVGFTTNIVNAPRRHFYLPRVPAGTISRAQILRDECRLVGIEPDVSQVTGTEIGYAVRDDAPPRTVIEDLMRVRAIDAAQLEGTLTFWDKRTTSARTLQLEDLGAVQGGQPGQSVVKELPGDPFDLPSGIVLQYLAYAAQYRRGAQRIGIPDGFEVAGADLTFESSLVMEDDDAAQAADLILQEARDIRRQYSTGLLPAQLDLHPGEVVTLPLDADRSVVAVITDMTQDMTIEAKFHRRDFDYASDAVGAPTPDVIPRQINLAAARFLALDIPILADADDDESFYWALYTVGFGSFTAASLFRSLDGGQTWDFYDSVNDPAKVAIAQGALADARPWRTDRVNTLDVRSLGGAPAESTTYDLARNGANTFAIQAGDEWELVNVQTVTALGDNLYRLSDIIRGRYGSEPFTGDHAAGDVVVRLDDDAVQRSRADDSKGLAALWVAATVGVPDAPKVAVAFSNAARGSRPRAPYPVALTRDGDDVDAAWRPCTRLEHGWLDGDASFGEGEDDEAYEVDIYEDETLLRTVEDLTVRTTTYTLAQYQSDAGGSPAPAAIPAGLEFRVYKISTTFGRGLPGSQTL